MTATGAQFGEAGRAERRNAKSDAFFWAMCLEGPSSYLCEVLCDFEAT